ncbi:helix-turn-helix domain-containing protein [Paludisphaera mucosa]|uniref:Helix-turn-helix domain-containing protein n=1 Tax=Paludisphaera mucosa TaxID=3030827 RepID=A0ABT6FL32_9BACT|nr:helix-turn-helix domain-containing protein [Paludisphaera mucosa]MDG3008283.1 helix-turn-helix domain-containing protein [Paludisphaera mucosa]
MAKRYVLKMTAEERADFARLVRKGNVAGWKLQRAQALPKCDQGPDGPAWPDDRIAEAFGVTNRSLESWHRRAVEHGPTAVLERKGRTPSTPPKLGGENEARLTAPACSQPPQGAGGWSLRLLAERQVELEVIGSVSHETVRRALEKAN